MSPVVLSGALDQYSAELLKQQLLDALAAAKDSSPELLVDMTAVEHLDASGLQVLLACKAQLKQEKLRLRGADASVRQYLRVAGADTFFEFSDLTS